MKYTLTFGLLGVYLVALGVSYGGWLLLLLWPGVSFLLVAAAYAGLGPRVYGKRADGRLAAWAVLLLLPYLLLTWVVWHLGRLVQRGPACHEIAPGLWLGRRPLAREVPDGVGLVVDLTAEFPRARGLAGGSAYHCLPVLDAAAPDERSLRELVGRVAAHPGAVYVHCAAGRGRSALVAAGVLLARGLADSAADAEAMLRRVRPGVRLTPPQRRLLERLAAAGKERPPINPDEHG